MFITNATLYIEELNAKGLVCFCTECVGVVVQYAPPGVLFWSEHTKTYFVGKDIITSELHDEKHLVMVPIAECEKEGKDDIDFDCTGYELFCTSRSAIRIVPVEGTEGAWMDLIDSSITTLDERRENR